MTARAALVSALAVVGVCVAINVITLSLLFSHYSCDSILLCLFSVPGGDVIALFIGGEPLGLYIIHFFERIWRWFNQSGYALVYLNAAGLLCGIAVFIHMLRRKRG